MWSKCLTRACLEQPCCAQNTNQLLCSPDQTLEKVENTKETLLLTLRKVSPLCPDPEWMLECAAYLSLNQFLDARSEGEPFLRQRDLK